MRFDLTRRLLIAAALALPSLFATASARADETVKVGIMSAEDEDLWAVVAQEAKKHGLTVKLTVFEDYTQPNEALENGELDANAFQHKPYLDNQIKTRGYHIVPVGYTAVWPIGLYSRKHHSVADLPDGAVIGVPNDPSNEGRALRVLESQGLIKLKPELASWRRRRTSPPIRSTSWSRSSTPASSDARSTISTRRSSTRTGR